MISGTSAVVLCVALLAPLADTAGPKTPQQKLLEGTPFSLSPGELRAAADALKDEDEEHVQTIFHQETVRIDREGRFEHAHWSFTRPLTRQAADEFGEVARGWQGWHENRPVLRARVVTSDGKEHQLDPKTIAEGPAGDDDNRVFSDSKLVRAPLSAVEKNSLVETEVLVGEHAPFFAAGQSRQLSLYRDGKGPMRVVVEFPTDHPPKWQTIGIDLKPQTSEHDGFTRLVFEPPTIPKASREDWEAFAPRESATNYPYLLVSTGKSWQEIAAAYDKLCEEHIRPDSVRKLVRETLGDEKDRQIIIAKLLAKVRSTVRYTGLEFGQSAIVPYTPEETLLRRYGDCKDQSVLFVSALRAAGISARVALVRSSYGFYDKEAVPSLSTFNHAIVFIPGERPQWIDPTAQFVPAGELPPSVQDRSALVVSPDTKELLQTPRTPAERNFFRKQIKLHFDSARSARMEVMESIGGAMSIFPRSNASNESSKKRQDKLRDFFQKNHDGARIASYTTSDPEDLSRPFRTDYLVEGAVFVSSAGQPLVSVEVDEAISFLPFIFRSAPPAAGGSPKPKTPAEKKRRNPVQIRDLFTYEYRIDCTPPDGFDIAKLPDDVVIHEGPFDFSIRYTRSDRKYSVEVKLSTGHGLLTAEEFERIRSRFRELAPQGSERWHASLVFQSQVQSLLGEKKFSEALAWYRKQLAASPKDASLMLEYASVLGRLGLGERARELAHQAAQLAPDSAETQSKAAEVLLWNDAGQVYARGCDRQGARQAAERALQLDEHDHLARIILADLEVRTDEGLYLPREPGLSKSISILQGRDESHFPLTDRGRVLLRLNSLYAGRIAELLKLLELDKQQLQDTPLLYFSAIGVQKGAPAALEEIERIAVSREKARDQCVNYTAAVLAATRRYGLAHELLQLAEKKGWRIEGHKELLTDCEKCKSIEAVEKEKDSPQKAVRQLFAAMIAAGLESQEANQFTVGPASFDSVPRRMWANLEEIQTLHRRDRIAGEIATPLMDGIFLWTLKTEGQDDFGYRVAITFSRATIPGSFQFVLKTAEGYRVILPGQRYERLGELALARVEAGDLMGARTLLGWAYDATVPPGGVGFFDAFSGRPFCRLWKSLAADNPEALRLAAALQMAGPATAAKAIPLLQAEMKKPDLSSVHKTQIIRALIDCFMDDKKRSSEALPLIDELIVSFPRAPLLPGMRIRALYQANRLDELRKQKEDLLAQPGKNKRNLQLAGLASAFVGEHEQAEKLFDEGMKEALDWAVPPHARAWNALFLDSPPSAALATSLDLEGRPGLALVAAARLEGEDLDLAVAALRNLMPYLSGKTRKGDWYLFGRLAHRLGETELAREYYGRVPHDDEMFSAPAEHRLSKLPPGEKK